MHLTFIIGHRRSCFMVHNNFYSFRCGITLQFLYIEVRISFSETVYKFLGISVIVFPAFIPSLYQYGIEAMFRCKVNILFYMSCIGTMMTIRFQLGIVSFTDYDVLRIGISPGRASSCKVFPPYTHVFGRLNPGSIFQLARFIQIYNQVRGQDITRIVAYYNRTPRSSTTSLDISFCPVFIRGKV